MMSGMPRLQVQRMYEGVQLPTYGSAGAGAFDVRAYLDPKLFPSGMVTIPPGSSHLFSTGLKFAIPEHFLMMMNIRSGLGAKYGLRIRNTIGYIDSDYRGELMVCLENAGAVGYIVKHEDRIAQCAIVAAPQFQIEETQELPETVRGAGGFGSTGS